MSLTNIKLRKSEGFTIVELLIVVVVIAILAAITIVSYNGITNKANASAAASTASTLQKKAELYASSEDGNGSYPASVGMLSSDSSKPYYLAPGTVKVSTSNPTSSNGKDTVKVEPCTGGLKITYYTWDSPATKTINVGTTTTCSGTWND